MVGAHALAGGLVWLTAAAALAQAGVNPEPGGRPTTPTTTTARARPAQGATDGKALFGEKCAMCHQAGGMGTGLLARRMDPKVAELEKRTDLTPDYVHAAVRQGIGYMPWLPRGEVSDPQLTAISAYLAKGNR